MDNKPLILDEWELSRWAYEYCKRVIDDPEIRQLITNQYFCYQYCFYVKDIKEIRNKITKSNIAYFYCFYINDDPEVRKNITELTWAIEYYTNISKEDERITKTIRENVKEYINDNS